MVTYISYNIEKKYILPLFELEIPPTQIVPPPIDIFVIFPQHEDLQDFESAGQL